MSHFSRFKARKCDSFAALAKWEEQVGGTKASG